jgi:hypothetical protein
MLTAAPPPCALAPRVSRAARRRAPPTPSRVHVAADAAPHRDEPSGAPRAATRAAGVRAHHAAAVRAQHSAHTRRGGLV